MAWKKKQPPKAAHNLIYTLFKLPEVKATICFIHPKSTLAVTVNFPSAAVAATAIFEQLKGLPAPLKMGLLQHRYNIQLSSTKTIV